MAGTRFNAIAAALNKRWRPYASGKRSLARGASLASIEAACGASLVGAEHAKHLSVLLQLRLALAHAAPLTNGAIGELPRRTPLRELDTSMTWILRQVPHRPRRSPPPTGWAASVIAANGRCDRRYLERSGSGLE
jgi:hypothetical protein